MFINGIKWFQQLTENHGARQPTLLDRSSMGKFTKHPRQVLYARLDSKGRGRVQISAELPLIYGRPTEPPEVLFPAEPDDITKQKRS